MRLFLVGVFVAICLAASNAHAQRVICVNGTCQLDTWAAPARVIRVREKVVISPRVIHVTPAVVYQAPVFQYVPVSTCYNGRCYTTRRRVIYRRWR